MAEAMFNHLHDHLLVASILAQDPTPRDSLRNRWGLGGPFIDGSQKEGHIRFSCLCYSLLPFARPFTSVLSDVPHRGCCMSAIMQQRIVSIQEGDLFGSCCRVKSDTNATR